MTPVISSPRQDAWHEASVEPLTKTTFLVNAEPTPAMARLVAEDSDKVAELDESDVDSLDESLDDHETPSKRSRIRALGHKIKSVPHRVLMRADIVGQAQPEMDAESKDIPGITDNPAFNVSLLQPQPQHGTVVSIGAKASEIFGDAKQFLAHPIHKAKREAAQQVTAAENPWLSQDADKDLIEAYDELEQARGRAESLNSNPAEPDSDDGWEVIEKKQKIHDLQTNRETRKSAWATAKHVRRVKAVRLPLVAAKPKEEDFNEFDSQGNFVRWKWEMYLGRLALWYTQDFTAQHIEDTNDIYFTREELIRQAERLLVASSPIQTFVMHLNKISLWEDPMLTLRWICLWLIMIKTGYIACTIWGYVVYSVIHNRNNRNHMDFMREAQERADSGGRPYKISELVQRHGSDGWLEPLVDELGPVAQTMLSDYADMLEILVNFYSWRDPTTTTYSLITYSTMALFTAIVSSSFGLKVIVFAAGMVFFILRPITVKYPRFRKVLSPSIWIYYDIPNNAEFAFKGLQQDAHKAKERMRNVNMDSVHQQTGQVHAGPRPIMEVSQAQVLESDSTNVHELRRSSNVLAPSSRTHHPTPSTTTHNDDILHFRGTYKGHLGRLVITPTHIRFTRTLPQQSLKTMTSTIPSASLAANDMFNHPYLHLLELRKTNSSMANLFKRKEIISTDALVIVWMDGTTDTIESMRKRDEAFNTIIGFSGLRFSVQQPLEGTLNGGPGGVTQGTGVGGSRTADDERRERGIVGHGRPGDGNTYGGARELGHGHGAIGEREEFESGRGDDEDEGKMDKFKRKVDHVLHRHTKSEGDGAGAAKPVKNRDEVVYMEGEAVKGDPSKHEGGSVFKEISAL